MLIGRRKVMRRGISLAECLMALLILPLAVAGVAYAVTSGQQQAAEALRRERAATLAEALMDEILAKPYLDPQGTATAGPDAGETARSLYDNMDDYNGFTESAGSLKTAGGVTCSSVYQTFRRSATCSYTTQTLLATTVNGLLITVTAADAKGTAITLTRFAANPS